MGSEKYSLEVYEAGEKETLAIFSSDNPFGAINRGDILYLEHWQIPGLKFDYLEVTRVEHIIWDIDGVSKHKIMVYGPIVKEP